MARILLLGTERNRTREVRSLVRQGGHEVAVPRSVDDWPDLEGELRPHLIVAPTAQPEEILAVPRRRTRGFAPPILFVHGEAEGTDELLVDDRLVDRIVRPFLDEELLARVDALTGVYQVLRGESIEDDDEDEDAGQRRVPFWRRLARKPAPRIRAVVPRLQVADRLVVWADRRDSFAIGHAQRTGSLCSLIAEGLSLPADETTTLMRAATLHDIGKVALSADLLHQVAPLDEAQRRLIRTHARRGEALVKFLDPNEGVARTVLCHHERPDGSGYLGYPPEQVPRTASILAVAECYDAMTSSLVGTRLVAAEALRSLDSMKSTMYDADCVEALADKLKPRPNVIPLSAPEIPDHLGD